MSLEENIERLIERSTIRKRTRLVGIIGGISAAVLSMGVFGYMLFKPKPESGFDFSKTNQVTAVGAEKIESVKHDNLALRAYAKADPSEGAEDEIAKKSSLLFMKDSRICICDYDGSNAIAIRDTALRHPSWSPDRKRIICSKDGILELKIENWGIPKIEVDRWDSAKLIGSRYLKKNENNKPASQSPGYNGKVLYLFPSYSPNGMKEAFFVALPDAKYFMEVNNLWCDCDFVKDDPAISSRDLFSWSPDSSTIAFVFQGNIRTDKNTITQNPEKEYQPCVSADGKRIAFVREVTDNRRTSNRSSHKNQRIFIVPVDGNYEAPLLKERMESETHPSWSPAGDQIIFLGQDKEGYGLYSVSPDGEGLKRLLRMTDRGSAIYCSPSWTLNGKKIAFSSDLENKGVRLYTMNSDGTGLSDLGFSDAYTPSWSGGR